MKKKYCFIDVIRLLSMLGIVYYHMLMSLYLCGIRQLDSIHGLFETPNMHIATVGVGLFFMISGAGLMLSSQKEEHLNLKKYYFKRFLRILVPFYVVYLLYLITFICLTGESLSGIYKGNINPLSIIFTLLGMDAYISSFGLPTYSLGIGEWFLGALVLMYLIFPLLRWGLRKNKWIMLSIMSIYYVIILCVYDYFPFATTVPGFVNFLCKVYEFFLGMFLITVIDRLPKKICLLLTIPVIVFYLIFPIPLREYVSYDLIILTQNLSFFLFFAGLEGVFNKIPHVIKCITFLGGFSYEFFLLHHKIIDYMTLQHIGVPFGNIDILVLFLKEFLVISVLTVLVKQFLKLIDRLITKPTNNKSIP